MDFRYALVKRNGLPWNIWHHFIFRNKKSFISWDLNHKFPPTNLNIRPLFVVGTFYFWKLPLFSICVCTKSASHTNTIKWNVIEMPQTFCICLFWFAWPAFQLLWMECLFSCEDNLEEWKWAPEKVTHSTQNMFRTNLASSLWFKFSHVFSICCCNCTKLCPMHTKKNHSSIIKLFSPPSSLPSIL